MDQKVTVVSRAEIERILSLAAAKYDESQNSGGRKKGEMKISPRPLDAFKSGFESA